MIIYNNFDWDAYRSFLQSQDKLLENRTCAAYARAFEKYCNTGVATILPQTDSRSETAGIEMCIDETLKPVINILKRDDANKWRAVAYEYAEADIYDVDLNSMLTRILNAYIGAENLRIRPAS